MIVPLELKKLNNWVGFHLIPKPGTAKTDKIPINPHTSAKAKSNDKSTWSSYEIAQRAVITMGLSGVGFMFEAPYLGIDLDHCVVNGKLNDFAKSIITKCNSFSEYSPSETGIHIIVKGEKPIRCKGPGIEMYQTGRFFTITGNVIPT